MRTYINDGQQRMRSGSISSSSSSNSGKYQRFNLTSHLRHQTNPTYAQQKHKYNYPHQQSYFYVNNPARSNQKKILQHSMALPTEKEIRRKNSEPQLSLLCHPHDSDREEDIQEQESCKKRRLSLAFSKKDEQSIFKKHNPIDKNSINLLEKFFGEMCKKVTKTPDFTNTKKLFYQALRDITDGLMKQMNGAKDQMICWIKNLKVEDQRLKEVGIVTQFNSYEDKLSRIMGNIDLLINETSCRIQGLINQSKQYKFWYVKQKSPEPTHQNAPQKLSSSKYRLNNSSNSNVKHLKLLSPDQNDGASLRSLVSQTKTQNECKMRDYSFESQPIQTANKTQIKPKKRVRNQRNHPQIYEKLHNFEETVRKMKASFKL